MRRQHEHRAWVRRSVVLLWRRASMTSLRQKLCLVVAGLIVFTLSIMVVYSWLFGFFSKTLEPEGVLTAVSAHALRPGYKGAFIIFTGPDITDTGGGSRAAQLALELTRNGWVVLYVNKNPAVGTTLMTENQFESNPELYLMTLKELVSSHIGPYAVRLITRNTACVVMVEYPEIDFIPILQQLKQVGATIVYDVMDEWDSDLMTYNPDVEEAIINLANHYVATLPNLADSLRKKGVRKDILLLENAVNTHVFDPSASHPLPNDIAALHGPLVVYTGALWGSWFDWQLLWRTASAIPHAHFIIIGDCSLVIGGKCPSSPQPLTNLHYLGAKPQTDLPHYYAHVSAAFMPWVVDDITKATSPLKVYEFMAMYVPVAVLGLDQLKEMPFIHVVETDTEFIQSIEGMIAGNSTTGFAEVEHQAADQYVWENSWKARLNLLEPHVLRKPGGE